HSWVLIDFRTCLLFHCPSSRDGFCRHSASLGQRRAAADLLLGATLVSSGAGSCLSGRVYFALGANRWTGRRKWNLACKSIFAGSASGDRATCVCHPANALLVQCQQRFPPLSVRRRCSLFRRACLRNCSGRLSYSPFYFLPVAHVC